MHLMKRRHFLASLGAVGLAPALPAVTVAAPAAPAYTPYMYGLGVHLARTQGAISTQALMKGLRISQSAAQAMQAQMIRTGVVTQTASGLAAQRYMQGRIATPARTALRPALDRAAKTLDHAQRAGDTPDDASKPSNLDSFPDDPPENCTV